MMKALQRHLALLLSALLLLCALSGCTAGLDVTKDPIAITIWHYYNGVQQQTFDALVQEFNETVGAQEGIVVTAHSQGQVNDLTQKALDALYNKVGAEELPDVFAAYSDTAYEIDQAGMVADLSQYLTQEEQDLYLASYLDEGRFDQEGFKIFPIAKSTELLLLNKTEWDAFAAATGASEEGLATWEGLAQLAEAYYQWSGGKAFFGRDAFSNYMIIGSYQLGTELFHVEDGQVTPQINADVMRRLWDCFYVPYISGCYTAIGNFRSDDMRTGDLVALVGSSSGAAYFPDQVVDADGNGHPIQGAAYPLPNFAGTQPVAVQQGAGMVVTRSTPEREQAAVTFLKWFTQPEQNISFSVLSGYLPVTYAANDQQAILQAAQASDREFSPTLLKSLEIGVDMTQTYTLYTSKPFKHGTAARAVVDSSMWDWAKADREEVLALMASGLSREEAVGQYNTDAQFERWLEDFTQSLTAAISG